MCTVDKMLIKGIRSFSPDNNNVIEFYKPLTLIVGANGAGKTTIIECLKLACTGELPPNTRSGQSFVHDPKVAGETEVKAQIKLRFYTAGDQPVTVVRSFQLSQKKSVMQFKTLDSVLQTTHRETGEKQAVTYRCADIDRMVPSLMGVSKAVLESVIFVHQEESNWPLAETTVLKKKFDDIFAATKYTKALEALRKLRSDKVASVKVLAAKLETVRMLRDTAERLTANAAHARAEMDRYQVEMASLQEKIDANQGVIAELDACLSRFADYGESKHALLAKHEVLQRQAADLLARLPEGDFTESTEQLEAWVGQFEESMRSTRLEIAGLSRDAQGRKMEGEALKDSYAQLCRRHGRLAAEAEAQHSHVAERDAFLLDSAAMLGLQLAGLGPGAPRPLAESAVVAFKEGLAAKVADADGALAALRRSHREAEAALSGSVDSVHAQISRAEESLRMKQAALKQAAADEEWLQSELATVASSRPLVDDAVAREREAEQRMNAKKAEQGRGAGGLETGLEEAAAALEEVARRISALRSERDAIAAASDSAMRLRLHRQDVGVKREQLSRLLAAKRARLLQLLGGQELPPVEGLKAAVEAAIRFKSDQLAARASELREASGKQQVAEAKVAELRAALQGQQGSLAALKAQLQEGIAVAMAGEAGGSAAGSPLPDLSSSCKANLDRLQQDLAVGESTETVLKSFRQAAVQHHKCPVCTRGFTGNEKDVCLNNIDYELGTLPEALANGRRKFAAAQAQMEALCKLQPLWLRASDLDQKELPALRSRLAAAEGAAQAAAGAASQAAQANAACEADLREANQLLTDGVWAMDRAARELAELQARLASMEAAAGATASAAADRTVADVDADLEEAEACRSRHEAAREELRRRLSRLKDEILAAQTACAAAKDERLRLQVQMDRENQLNEKLTAAMVAQQELSVAVARLADEQAPLLERRAALCKEREAMRAAAAAAEAEQEEVRRSLAALSDRLASKLAPLADYEARGGGTELERMSASLEDLKKRLEGNSRSLADLEAKLKEREAYVADQEGVRRQIQAVLDWRRSKAACDAVAAELEALERQMAAEGERSAKVAQLTGLQSQVGDWKRRQDMLRGALGIQDQALAKARQELSAPQYAGIEGAYRRGLIELKTTELANGDLDKYHRALEKALLSFHTTKMTDINKVVKELWQKTYRGQDIDYIQIRADADGARSYNYRVVMVSGGAELEMRGRCSAGQKVLACLIIRLALAETFCLNCGILALDEPTTNLDADNSAGLAEALRALMMSRREQQNFQLVVITHDERFAQMIGTREHAENMWRITKDEQQHTHIALEAIDE